MIKADERVSYNEAEKQKFTHFELLVKKVEELQRVVNEHAEILRQNSLVKLTTEQAPMFDDDRVYSELEEED